MKQEMIGQGAVVVLIVAVVAAVVGGAMGYLLAPAEEVPTDIAELQAQISNLEGTVSTQESKISDLEAELAAIPPKPGEGIRIDFINQASGEDPVFAAVMQGAKDFCEPMGIELVCRHAEGDVTKLPAWIDAAVTAGTDGIFIVGFVPEVLTPPIQRAQAAGVPVCMSVIDLPETGRKTFAGVGDLWALGKMKAEPLDPYLHDGSYVLAAHEEFSIRTWSYRDAALDHWENELGIHVEVVDLECTNELTTIESRIAAELIAHPDKYDAILAMGGVTTAGANLAEITVGLEPGEIPITGLDFLAPTIEGIRNGYTIGVISWQPWSSGYLPPAILYPLIKWELEPPSEVITGIKLVDSTNLEEFLEYVEIHRW